MADTLSPGEIHDAIDALQDLVESPGWKLLNKYVLDNYGAAQQMARLQSLAAAGTLSEMRTGQLVGERVAAQMVLGAPKHLTALLKDKLASRLPADPPPSDGIERTLG